MDCVGFDWFGEEFVDCVFGCVFGIGCVYDVVVVFYGVFVFECLDDDWVVDYEGDEIVEEWVFFVDCVEVFGLFFGYLDVFWGDDV